MGDRCSWVQVYTVTPRRGRTALYFESPGSDEGRARLLLLPGALHGHRLSGQNTDPARGSGHMVPTSPWMCVGPEWSGHRALALPLPRGETPDILRGADPCCQGPSQVSIMCARAAEAPAVTRRSRLGPSELWGLYTGAAFRGPHTFVYGGGWRRRSQAQPARAPCHTQSRDVVPTSVQTWSHTERCWWGAGACTEGLVGVQRC